MYGKLIYRFSKEVNPLTPLRTRFRHKRQAGEMISRFLRLPLLPRSPSFLIKLEKTKRKDIIKIKGILGNPRIQPFQPPESTRPRSVAREGGTKRTLVESCIITITKRDILQTSLQSLKDQKTSISLGNLHVND